MLDHKGLTEESERCNFKNIFGDKGSRWTILQELMETETKKVSYTLFHGCGKGKVDIRDRILNP